MSGNSFLPKFPTRITTTTVSATIVNTNKDLLAGLSQENEASFEEIYTKYWSKLYTIAYNRLNSKHAAEDVVQEVMTSLWQRRNEVQIDDLEAWLAAATRYSVFRQLAKYGTQTILPISSQAEIAYTDNFDFKFLDQMLRESIHRLPEKCRLVFNYSRENGLSNKEIASELDISEKAVEKHITKAISKLRLKLKQAIPFIPFM